MSSTKSYTTTSSTYRKFSTSTPIVCAKCHQQIDPDSSKAMKAGSRFWHEHHFTCSICGVRLKDNKVFQKDDKLYCDADYKNNFVPRCAFCSGYIMEGCIRALNQTWHPEHFTCRRCGRGFSEDEGFHEKNGVPYCKGCFIEVVCEKCAGCNRPITGKAIRAMDKDWHVECFACQTCRKSFEGETSFFCLKGQPICEQCLDS